ncbi:MAG: ABC transporter substrate-binding protein [Chthoniobacterales bacterium]|nr:ABC transporter substrate-binding protein [Chthoniobacterales bacterium]
MLPSRAISLLACAAAMAVPSCGKRELAPVKIGLNLELTGDIQTIGQSAKNAAELFFAQANDAGGAKLADGPHKFQLVTSDNGANATQAAGVAQQFISRDNVTAVIGPNSGHCAITASDIAEGLKCVMISPWSSDPETTMDRGAGVPKRYVFRAGATDDLQGRVMARFALDKLGARKAAIISETAPGAAVQAGAFKEAFTAGGGEIVAQENISAGDAEASSLAAAVAAAAPDTVFVAASCERTLPFLAAAKAAGIDAGFLGTELWNSPQSIRMTSLGIDGLFFCKNFDHRADFPAARKFVAAYTAKYGQPPDDVAALAYDACGLVAAAMEKSGKNDRESLRENLARLAGYEGVTGVFDFHPGSGDPVKSLPVLQIKSTGMEWAGTAAP